MATSIYFVSTVLTIVRNILTIVGCILLATDQKLWMEQLTVFASSNLIDRLSSYQQIHLLYDDSRSHRRIEVDKDGSRNVFWTSTFVACLGEKGFI